MRFKTRSVAHFFAVFFTITFIHSAAAAPDADDQPAPSATATNSADARYGLFNALDHRSLYTQEVFPEPFLVDDMGLEDNELQFTWLHTKGSGQQNDTSSVEFQKGIGLLTLELQVPYERNADPDDTIHGIGNIEMGARYPLYQFVSADQFIDATFGVAMQGSLPVDSTVSRNAELDPEIFNCLKLGDHFTVQTVLGYSTLLGSGNDGGTQTFEYGFSFAYTIPHRELPLPGVQEFIPIFELAAERGLNKEEAGLDSVLADVGFRFKFKPIGELQPGLGLAYVFPIDSGARAELHWGFVVSLIFDF